MTYTIAVVTAGLSRPSSTRMLADQLAAATERVLGDSDTVRVEVVELRDLAHQLVDNLLSGFPSGALADAVRLVGDADALIAVTPIFNASYSGLFKTFLDVLDEGTLENTPVLLAASAGSARHSLAIDFALRPLFAYLRADVMPTAVFAASEDFGSTAAGSLSARVDRAARELAEAVRGSRRAAHEGADDGVTPFEQLLAGVS